VILRALALRLAFGVLWFWLTGLAFLALDLYT
jgi:hypothetical protein